MFSFLLIAGIIFAVILGVVHSARSKPTKQAESVTLPYALYEQSNDESERADQTPANRSRVAAEWGKYDVNKNLWVPKPDSLNPEDYFSKKTGKFKVYNLNSA